MPCVLEIPLDDVDEAILRELQVDGRRAYREIARTVGVSEGTVRTRVKRLREAGLLRILAFVDPSRIGRSVLALVFASVDAAQQDAVIAELVTWPEATYVSTLIGRADVYMQVIARDNRALWELIGRLRALERVRDTETMIETQVHAFAYRDFRARPTAR